jgi:hypothetical protein
VAALPTRVPHPPLNHRLGHWFPRRWKDHTSSVLAPHTPRRADLAHAQDAPRSNLGGSGVPGGSATKRRRRSRPQCVTPAQGFSRAHPPRTCLCGTRKKCALACACMCAGALGPNALWSATAAAAALPSWDTSSSVIPSRAALPAGSFSRWVSLAARVWAPGAAPPPISRCRSVRDSSLLSRLELTAPRCAHAHRPREVSYRVVRRGARARHGASSDSGWVRYRDPLPVALYHTEGVSLHGSMLGKGWCSHWYPRTLIARVRRRTHTYTHRALQSLPQRGYTLAVQAGGARSCQRGLLARLLSLPAPLAVQYRARRRQQAGGGASRWWLRRAVRAARKRREDGARLRELAVDGTLAGLPVRVRQCVAGFVAVSLPHHRVAYAWGSIFWHKRHAKLHRRDGRRAASPTSPPSSFNTATRRRTRGCAQCASTLGSRARGTTHRSWVEQIELAASSPSTCRSYCEVRLAGESVGAV